MNKISFPNTPNSLNFKPKHKAPDKAKLYYVNLH